MNGDIDATCNSSLKDRIYRNFFFGCTSNPQAKNEELKMGLSSMVPSLKPSLENPRTRIISSPSQHFVLCPVPSNAVTPKLQLNSLQNSKTTSGSGRDSIEATFPTMNEITESSRAQKLDLQLRTLGPFFRITAKSLETQNELGRAEGFIRVWLRGTILHLDSIRLRRETLGMEKSIFGIGLFIGAVAIRYGYDCGCRTAELLAINDSELYHRKVLFLPFIILILCSTAKLNGTNLLFLGDQFCHFVPSV